MQARSQTSIAVTAFDTGIRVLQNSDGYKCENVFGKEKAPCIRIIWWQDARRWVEHVDQNEAECDEKNNPCRDDVLRRMKKLKKNKEGMS